MNDEKCYIPCDVKPNESVIIQNDVKLETRDKLNTEMPPPSINGGLYRGPQVNHPWMPIAVTPTETNMLVNNLKSANPPPGAMDQFISNIRPGNNYVAKKSIYNYTDTDKLNCGPFRMQGPQ